jgi:hypothetical protein
MKGILYESCVNFCQIKATGGPENPDGINFSKMLDGSIGKCIEKENIKMT